MSDREPTRQADQQELLVDLDERVTSLEEAVSHNSRIRDGDARRKAEQRVRDLADGWRQLNVKAPNNPAARALLSRVASEIASERKRDAVAASLDEPGLVLMAQQYKRLLRLVAIGGALGDAQDAETAFERAHLLILSRLVDLHPSIEREFNRLRDESQDTSSTPSP